MHSPKVSFQNLLAILTSGLILFSFFSCSKFEFSPNQVKLNDDMTDLNAKAIEHILQIPARGIIKIGFTADTQGFYSEADAFVNRINTIPDIDFVLVAGDLVEYGLQREYEMIHSRFSKMYMPYVAVIGNHGHLANGEEVYRRMYGPLDFVFVHDSIKYIFANTNGLEYNFNGQVPDMNWLNRELNAGPEVRDIIVMCHVPPFSNEFDPILKEPFIKAMRESSRLMLVLYGHTHVFDYHQPFGDGVYYLNPGSLSGEKFILLTIDRNNYNFSRISL